MPAVSAHAATAGTGPSARQALRSVFLRCANAARTAARKLSVSSALGGATGVSTTTGGVDPRDAVKRAPRYGSARLTWNAALTKTVSAP